MLVEGWANVVDGGTTMHQNWFNVSRTDWLGRFYLRQKFGSGAQLEITIMYYHH